MSLTPIQKKHDPYFNERAAKAAYDLVSKMDHDEAAMFVEIVVAEVLEDTIEKNLRTLQRRVDEIVTKRMEAVSKAVSKTGSPEHKRALEIIKKDWVEDMHPRASDGRFKTKIKSSYSPGQKPVNRTTAETIGIRSPKNNYAGMNDEQKVRYQQQYTQLANFLQNVQQNTGGDTDLLLHYRDADGTEYTQKTSGTKADPELLMPRSNTQLVGIEARPTSLNLGGATFGLATALGADASSSRVGRTGATVQAVDGNMTSWSNDWLKDTDPKNSNTQLYGRVKTGSDILNTVGGTTGNTNLLIAAQFGQFVGSHGPEAEKVIGPTARRTAYRYRGVTKEPDKRLVTVYDRAVNDAKMASAADPYRNTPEGRRANLKAPAALSPVQMAAQRVSAERRDATFEERENGRRVVRTYLDDRLPKQPLYKLQLAAGNTPPSEGVLIDKTGKVVAQAVGYGDDHYLPFNLKNLKQLRGGEYIRTRSVGGPTTEDIYTGLMSGAKQVTVVSRSGTFVIEFEDDFKGGRRYNDKALRMTKRYAQILDAVQSQQVDRADLDPKIKNAIAAQVRADYKGLPISGVDTKAEIDRRIQDFKDSPDMGSEENELAEFMVNRMQARADAGDVSQRDADNFRTEIMQEMAAEKEFKFRLNANGYKASMDALREQFPYYIKEPKFIPRKENEARNAPGELDRSYVEPGKNRPTAASAGLFGAKAQHSFQGQGGKFSAAEANYQKGSPRPPLNDESAESKGLTPTGDKKATVKAKIEENRNNAKFAVVAMELQEYAKGKLTRNPADLAKPELHFTAEDLQDPVKRAQFDKFAGTFWAAMGEAATKGEEMDYALKGRYQEASGHVGRKQFEEADLMSWQAKPYTGFNTDASKRPQRLAEIDRMTGSGVTSTKRLSEMSDSELNLEFIAASTVKRNLEAMGDMMDPETKAEVFSDAGVKAGLPGTMKALSSTQAIDRHLRSLHEVRALNTGVPDTDRIKPTVLSPAPPTKDEMQDAKAATEGLIRNFEEAAAIFEQGGADDEGKELRNAAGSMKEQLKVATTPEQVRAAFSAYSDQGLLELAGKAYAHRDFQAQVKTTENVKRDSGSILGD